MNKNLVLTSVCLLAATSFAFAQSNTTVNMDSGSFTLMNQSNTALTAGAVGDGNGAVLQLGYYTGATSAGNNFLGTWVPLTGAGSLNTDLVPLSTETYNQTSIGDRNIDTGNTAGTFSLQLLFGTDAGSSHNLPTAGTILSIRFYNGTTLGGSTFYNTVSDNLWVWQTPAAPPANPVISMSLDNQGLLWEGGINSAFHTTLPFAAVPEPSTYASALLGLGGLGLAMLRRRFRK